VVQAHYQELLAIRQEVAPDAQTDLLAQALRMPDVFLSEPEEAADDEWNDLLAVVQRAANAFDTFRQDEGTRLRGELQQRAARIGALLAEVEGLDTGRIGRTRERLQAKLQELRLEVDRDRFEQELVYYLEKLDLTEEKVRLRSHLAYFNETLDGTDQGRKLGFIAQEMGREINTLGSKANDAAIQRIVVLMKDELEKIKEQVMNVL
jgi:uncharacterized protein (TIGR00255 family)